MGSDHIGIPPVDKPDVPVICCDCMQVCEGRGVAVVFAVLDNERKRWVHPECMAARRTVNKKGQANHGLPS